MAATSNRLQALISRGAKPVIGMVHVLPTLASHRYREPHDRLVETAVSEAETLIRHGVHAVLIENMHDTPYQRESQAGPELTASMTVVAAAVRQALPRNTPLGIQTLSGCNRMALAVAKAVGLDFVRAEGFVFAHVGDEGLQVDACAADLLRYRRQLNADANISSSNSIWLLADVKKKHAAHAITGDLSLAETAAAAEFFCADAVVVTGRCTGQRTAPADVAEAAGACSLPVFVGSGASVDDLQHLWRAGGGRGAAGFIVGSALKLGGVWSGPVDAGRVEALMREHARLSAA